MNMMEIMISIIVIYIIYVILNLYYSKTIHSDNDIYLSDNSLVNFDNPKIVPIEKDKFIK